MLVVSGRTLEEQNTQQPGSRAALSATTGEGTATAGVLVCLAVEIEGSRDPSAGASEVPNLTAGSGKGLLEPCFRGC